jgi:inorganic pyrophosphatase
LREVEHFFTIYKELAGVQIDVIGWADRDRACQIVTECVDRYSRK